MGPWISSVGSIKMESHELEEIRRYETRLNHCPGSLKDRYLLGLAYLRGGQLDRACSELEGVVEGLLEVCQVFSALNELYRRLGMSERAERIRGIASGLRSRLSVPEEPQGMKGPGRSPRTAAASRKESGPLSGSPGIYTRTLAEIYKEQGHFKEAIEVLKGVLSLHPEEADGIVEEIDQLRQTALLRSKGVAGGPQKEQELLSILSGWIREIEKKREESPCR